MREPAIRNQAQPETVEPGPQANEPISAALAAVHTARETLAGVRAKGKQIESKLSRVDRDQKKREADATEDEETFQRQVRQAILTGAELPTPPDTLVQKMKLVEQTGKASRSAVQAMQAERDENAAAQREAETVLAGAVFNLTVQHQESARRQIIEYWRRLAPLFSELMAIEDIRDRYCRQGMKLSGVTDRPWSGAVLVNKLIDGIPDKLSGPAIAKDRLRQQADSRASEIIREIEGDKT